VTRELTWMASKAHPPFPCRGASHLPVIESQKEASVPGADDAWLAPLTFRQRVMVRQHVFHVAHDRDQVAEQPNQHPVVLPGPVINRSCTGPLDPPARRVFPALLRSGRVGGTEVRKALEDARRRPPDGIRSVIPDGTLVFLAWLPPVKSPRFFPRKTPRCLPVISYRCWDGCQSRAPPTKTVSR
jgi:hypothetical protein